MTFNKNRLKILLAGLLVVQLLVQGCGQSPHRKLPVSEPSNAVTTQKDEYRYLIGPGDVLNIFVWKNEQISSKVMVRPDGMISTPLVDDLKVSEKTPSQVAKEIEKLLSEFIREPIVTITLENFVGPYHEQVRVIGEATRPQSLPYSENMTLLDVIIRVGGLTEFSDGNNAVLARVIDGKYEQFSLRMDDLLQKGDMQANVDILPGDIIIIPESWF